MARIICAAAFILFFVVVSAQDVREGFCPLPGGFETGLCSYTCKKDSDCLLATRKCCPSKCGGTNCRDALKEAPVAPTTQAPSIRTGTCPGILFTSKEKCGLLQISTCSKDADCLGTRKCCSNGCVLQCRFPAAEKIGTCPTSNDTCSVKHCAADSDCIFGLKCCANGCKCMIPEATYA